METCLKTTEQRDEHKEHKLNVNHRNETSMETSTKMCSKTMEHGEYYAKKKKITFLK